MCHDDLKGPWFVSCWRLTAKLAFCLLLPAALETQISAQNENGRASAEPFEVVDRFGARLRGEELARKVDTLTVQETCGHFRLDFQDLAAGFADPALGAGRRLLVCRVFNDLSKLLVSPSSSAVVDLAVRESTIGMPAAALGVASSYYLIPAGVDDGQLDGEVWKTLNNGVSSYLALETAGFWTAPPHHGFLQINFDHDFFVGADTPPGANQYDLYSVVLHEAFHSLGFASLIDGQGKSKLNQASPGLFARFDGFLRNAQGTDLLTIANSCYAAQTTPAAAGAIRGGCGAVLFAGKYGYLANPQPVYAPAQFSDGSSLSHFDPSCAAGNPAYVMAAAAGTGPAAIRRAPSVQEVQALCELGFATTSTYGSVATSPFAFRTYPSCGTLLAGVDDVVTAPTPTGQPSAAIAVLPNDEAAASFRCAEPILGGGSVTPTTGSTTFSYTSAGDFSGRALLRYLPQKSSKSGNMTFVLVPIKPQAIPPCPPDACNLICHGDLEVYGDQFLAPLNDFQIDPTKGNSPDRLTQGGSWNINCNPAGTNGIFPAPHSGQVFAGFSTYFGEGLAFELYPPMMPGSTYRVSAWAHRYDSNCLPALVFFANATPPCPAPVALANCASWAPQKVMETTVPVLDWQQYATGSSSPHVQVSAPMTTLVVHSKVQPGQFGGVMIDDIEVVKIGEPQLTVTSSVSPAGACPGDVVEFRFKICRKPNEVVTAPVKLRDLLPPPLVRVGGDFDAALEATLAPSAFAQQPCAELVLKAQLTGAPGAWPLQNQIVLESGGCAAQGSSSVVALGPGQPFVKLTKTVDDPTPAPGDRILYSIEVCNHGPSPAGPLTVVDDLPPGLSMPFSWDFQPQGKRLEAKDLELPAGAPGAPACKTLTFSVQVDADAEGQIVNCARIEGSSAACGPGGQACVTVEVPAYRCPPGAPHAVAGGIHYPDASCEQATLAARGNLTSFHYRQACQKLTGGTLPGAVYDAKVASCQQAASGAVITAEVCCSETPPPCPTGSDRRTFDDQPLFFNCAAISSLVASITTPYTAENVCWPGPGQIHAIHMRACDDTLGRFSYDLCCSEPPPPPCPPGSERVPMAGQTFPFMDCEALGDFFDGLGPATVQDVCWPGSATLTDIQLVACRNLQNGGADFDLDLCCRRPGPPDLAIEKRPGGEFFFGEPGTYVLEVGNAASLPAGGATTGPIEVVDQLPLLFRPIPASGSFSVPGWECQVAAQEIRCTYNGVPLAPGAKAPPITLQVLPVASREPVSVPNCATVRHEPDSNAANDRACHLAPVSFAPDLVLEKVLRRTHYELTVTNLIESSNTGAIELTDILPSHLVFDHFEGSPGWTCIPGPVAPTGQSVRCTHPGPLAGRASLVLKIYFTGSADAGKRNCARVDTDHEANLTNNTACACPDPADPRVHYRSHDPAQCRRIACTLDQRVFDNACGCGCIDQPPPVLDPDFPWRLRISAGSARSRGVALRREGSESLVVETRESLSAGSQFHLGLERRLGRNLGLEIGYLHADAEHELEVRTTQGTQVGSSRTSTPADFRAATATLAVHLAPAPYVDVYGGLLLAAIDFTGSGSGTTELAGGVALGASLGVDWTPGGARWSLGFRSLYLPVEAGSADPAFDVEWLSVGLAVGYRF